MTARLRHICRHPIKAHGREELASVLLSPGACLPWDRHWAVAHEAARLSDGWSACQNFTRGAKAPGLMAITAALDEATATVRLSHPDLGPFAFRPDDPQQTPGFLDWVAPLMPEGRPRPARVVSADRGMTDSAFPSISILSLSSLEELSARMGQPLSIHRWRGNLWVEGWKPWTEFDLIGREIRVGAALLRIEERITRCRATMADPESGMVDADTLGALQAHYGHRDFGIYATVLEGGPLTIGDEVRS
ncbi:MOSC domain-containing protein [Cereibacter azotoformans]|uniref:MOSC domain containing protein n=1 Tax=Cereibacter sphaeroides (strain ATCC 17025 / ATH 2.4.3) TaxID=349102 RepID=A4WWJ0_CERS5|nr:MOSC domain-containing protein [Cereibacter azotoformans]ULB10977.1 MOSC domain-containing protein [Cereibacter azotoformans]